MTAAAIGRATAELDTAVLKLKAELMAEMTRTDVKVI